MDSAPDHSLVVHRPATSAGAKALRQSIAAVHADFVLKAVLQLDCPISQKLELLEEIAHSALSS